MDFDFLLTNWIRGFILLCLTDNPTGWSYLGWINAKPDLPMTLVGYVGFLLFLGYWFFFRLALKRVRGGGILLIALAFFVLIIGLAQWSQTFPYINYIPAEWLLLTLASLFMAIAVSVRPL